MKKIASLRLSCTLVLCSLNTRVFAACNTPDESLLVEMGFPVEIIEIMPNSDKADFIEAYINKYETP